MLSPLAALFACTFLVGTVVTLWMRLPWVFSQRLHVPEPVCRDWQSWFSLPLVFLFPVLGHFIDGLDGQYVLFIGILGLAMSLAWLGQFRNVRSGLIALLLMCVAIPCIVLPTFAILPRVFAHSPTHLESAALPAFRQFKHVLVMNLAFTGVVLGYVLTPGLVKMVIKRFDVRHGFLFLAMLCLVPALLVALSPTFDQPEPKPLGNILQDGRGWMIAALAFVFYLQVELFHQWKAGYLQQSERGTPWVCFVFWLVVLLGLPIAGWAVWDRYESWGLAVLALMYAVVLGNMAGDLTNRSGTLSLWMAGGCFAPVLPTLLTIPAKTFHENPSTAMGLALGAGALGNFLMQPMLERFAQRNSVASTMWLATVLSLGFGALALVLALMQNLAGGAR